MRGDGLGDGLGDGRTGGDGRLGVQRDAGVRKIVVDSAQALEMRAAQGAPRLVHKRKPDAPPTTI